MLQGILDESWSSYFSGMAVICGPAGMTRLCGEVADQSALHGILNKIRDLNLKLVSLQLLDNDGLTPLECRNCVNRNIPAKL